MGGLSLPVLKSIVSANLAADNLLVTGVPGKKIYVYAFELLTRGATVITFRSNTTPLTGAMNFSSGGAWQKDFNPDFGPGVEEHFVTADGANLHLLLSAAVQVDGMIWYIIQ